MSSAHSSTQSSASGPVLGIDLGTTNSVVAVADGTQARVLADPDGRRLIPSVVSFHPDGSILVGHEARERRLVDARNTVYSIKRLIGRPFSSVEVQKARERFAFELEPSKVGGVQVKVRRGTFALPEISAMVLRHLRKIAEAALDQPCSRAVITVPANFNELQRSATQAAGKVAGLDVLRILNEPTAATLAYGYGKEKPESVAVYDLGGGTFDITILDLDKDVFEVVSTAGDTFLGGDDIDLLLAERMADACLRELRYDAKADPQSFERLRAAAEWAKCQLSMVEEVEVTLEELFHEANGRAVHFTYRTTRAELEERMRPLIARTFDVVVEALREAGRRPKEIDSVVLVGGSTRIPLVRNMVREHFGREPRMDIDPDLVVAQGAAIHAFNLSGEKRGSLRPKGPKALGRVALRKITVADHKAAKAKSNAEKMPKQPAFAPEDPRDAVAVGTLSLDDEWKDSPTRVAPEAEMAKARAESRRPPAPASPEPAKPAASEALPARPKRKSVVIEEVSAPRRDRRDDAPARRMDERQDVPRSDGRPPPAVSKPAVAKPAVGKPVVPPPRVPRPAPIATDDDEPTTFGNRDALQLSRDEVPSPPSGLAQSSLGQGSLAQSSLAQSSLAQSSLAQGSLAQGSLGQGSPLDSLPSLFDPGLDPFGAGAPLPSVLEPAPDPLGSLAGAPRPPVQPVAVMAPPQAIGTPLLDLDPVEATPERHAATPARRLATSPGITPFDLDDPMVSSVHPMAPAPTAPVVKVAPARAIADAPRPPPPPPPPPPPQQRAPMMSSGPSPDAPAVLSPASLGDDFGFPPVPMPSAALPLVMDTAPRIPDIQMSERAAPLLMDVTPLSLGIETVGGYCQPIVGRNAPIPTEKTRVFSTARDDQDRVELRVCQGESNRFEENQSLGTLLLDEIRKARRGEVRVEVTFMIDASGILDVKATDLDTKRVQSIRIALKGGLDHGEIDAMRGRQAELFPTG